MLDVGRNKSPVAGEKMERKPCKESRPKGSKKHSGGPSSSNDDINVECVETNVLYLIFLK